MRLDSTQHHPFKLNSLVIAFLLSLICHDWRRLSSFVQRGEWRGAVERGPIGSVARPRDRGLGIDQHVDCDHRQPRVLLQRLAGVLARHFVKLV